MSVGWLVVFLHMKIQIYRANFFHTFHVIVMQPDIWHLHEVYMCKTISFTSMHAWQSYAPLNFVSKHCKDIPIWSNKLHSVTKLVCLWTHSHCCCFCLFHCFARLPWLPMLSSSIRSPFTAVQFGFILLSHCQKWEF